MFEQYIIKSQQLIAEGRPFVVALVVNYVGPISGKPGDRAIVTEEGKLWGWVAGGCSQAIIIEEALNVLNSGSPKLIQITPDPDQSNSKITKHKMTCHSGGTLDVYLEPVIPKPCIVILGKSAIAEKLEKLGKAMEYQVLSRLDITKIIHADRTFIVVATQGDGDEAALEQALSFQPIYLGFVASRKKAEAVKGILSERGISAALLNTIKAPAGIDIKARSPEEIALSIYAEIVMVLRQQKGTLSKPEEKPKATDPVCGMQVTMEGAEHMFSFKEVDYYFCCAGCKQIFSQEPERFLLST